jgi:hypothetical protein
LKLNIVTFLDLSVDKKIEILKENNITIHPFLWMMLSDGLKNSISSIQGIVGEKLEKNPPGVLSVEEMKRMAARCDDLGVTLTKIHSNLVEKVKDEEYG